MADDERLIIESGIDLKGVERDLVRMRQLALSYGTRIERELNQQFSKGFGKTGAPRQLTASLTSVGTASSASGAKIQQLTKSIELQHRSFTRLQQQLTAQRTSLTSSQQAVTKLGGSFDAATKFLANFGRSGSLAGAALTAVPYASVAAGVLGIVGAYKLLKPAIVDTNATLEMNQRQWTVLLGGNAEAARGLLGEFKALANVAPFDFGDVNAAAKMLKGAGVPAKELLSYLTDIGNVASTFSENPAQGVESITRALAQMRTSGRVNAEDVGQLTTQGIPAWDILAESIGKSVAETRKLSEAGRITSDVFIDAFRTWSQNNFAGAMEDAAGTFTGAMATISDSVKYGSAQTFQPFFELIRDGAVSIAEFVKSDEFAAWSAQTAVYMGMAADAIRDLLGLLGVDVPTAEERAAQGADKVAAANETTAKAVNVHAQAQRSLSDTLDASKTKLEAAERTLGPLEDAVESTGATLDAAKARFDRFAQATIAGTQSFADAIFAVQQEQAQAQLALLDFKEGPLADMLAPMQHDIDNAKGSVEDWQGSLESANDAVEAQKEKINDLSDAMPEFDQRVEDASRTVDHYTERLKAAEDQHKMVTDAIKAQEDALSSWQDAELKGTDRYRQATQAIDDRLLKARQNLNNLQRAGADDDAIDRAREAIDALRLEREAIELAQEADIGVKEREIEDRARTVTEVSFEDAITGVDSAKAEIERLNAMLPEREQAIQREQAALEGAQGALSEAEAARRLHTEQIEREQIALAKLEEGRDKIQSRYEDEKKHLEEVTTAYQTTEANALAPYEKRLEGLATAEQRLTLQRGLALDALERERDLLVNPPEELSWDEIEAGLKREAAAVGEATVAHGLAEAALKARKDEIKLMQREIENLEVSLANLAKAAAPASSGMGDTSYTPPPTPSTPIATPIATGGQWAAIRTEAEPVLSWLSGTALPAVGKAMDDVAQKNLPALREGTKNEFAIINDVGTKFAAYWVNDVTPQIREAWRITQEKELPALKTAYGNTFGEIQTSIDNVTTWFRDTAWPTWSTTYDSMREQGLNPLSAAFKTAWGLSGGEGMWGTVSTSLSGMYQAVLTKFGLTEDDGIQGIVKKASPIIQKWVLHPYTSANDALKDAAGPLAQLGMTFSGWMTTATTVGGALYDASLAAGTSIVDTLKAGITAGWETFTTWWKGKLEGLLALVPEGMRRFLPGGGGTGGPKVNPAPLRTPGGTISVSQYDVEGINAQLAGSPIAGYGQQLAEYAEKYQVPVEAAMAIMWVEGQYGKLGRSNGNRNPGNIRGPYYGAVGTDDKRFSQFASWEDGIEAVFNLLRNDPNGYAANVDKYRAGDVSALLDIIKTYAPAGDEDNDPEVYYNSVLIKIEQLLDSMLAADAHAGHAHDHAPTTRPSGTLLEQLIAAMTEGGRLTGGWHTGPGWGGIDIGAPMGSDIRSVQSGKVVHSGYNDVGGWSVIIEDALTGLKTYYGHMREMGLEVGKIVEAGDIIGKVGSTGDSTGPHIHFQSWLNNVLQNPLQMLAQLVEAAYGTGAGADMPWDNVTAQNYGATDPMHSALSPENTRLLIELFEELRHANPTSPLAPIVSDLEHIYDIGLPRYESIIGDFTGPLDEQVTLAKASLAEMDAALANWRNGVRPTEQLGMGEYASTGDTSLFGSAAYNIPAPVGSPLLEPIDMGSIGEDLAYGISDPIGESLLQTTDMTDQLKYLFEPSEWAQPLAYNLENWTTFAEDGIEQWRRLLDYARSGDALLADLAASSRLSAESVGNAVGSVPSGGTSTPTDSTGGGTTINNDNRSVIVHTNNRNVARAQARRMGFDYGD